MIFGTGIVEDGAGHSAPGGVRARGDHEDIVGLQVAVQDAATVGMGEPRGQPLRQGRRQSRGQAARRAGEPAREGLALLIRGRDEEDAVDHAGVQDRDDRLVVQRRGQAGLAGEPPPERRVLHPIGPGDLQRDPTSQPDVEGQVDDPEAAPAQLVLDAEAPQATARRQLRPRDVVRELGLDVIEEGGDVRPSSGPFRMRRRPFRLPVLEDRIEQLVQRPVGLGPDFGRDRSREVLGPVRVGWGVPLLSPHGSRSSNKRRRWPIARWWRPRTADSVRPRLAAISAVVRFSR